MIVNGKDLARKFQGKIRFGQQTIQPRDVKTYTEWLDHTTAPKSYYNPEPQFFDVTIEMIITGNTKNDAERCISDVTNDFIAANSFKLDDVDFLINAEVSGIEKEFVRKWAYKVTVTLQAWDKITDQVTVMLNSTTQTINVAGNKETPCIVEILPNVDVSKLQIHGVSYDRYNLDSGIEIRNLKQGKKIVINGEDCTALQEGKNKFSDLEIWNFPKLNPGSNTISITSDQCSITIKYKPRYV